MESSSILTTLVMCGLMGMLGQGIRAAVGLKSSATLSAQNPGQQAQFDAAYFALSLMIGFIAGVLAGIVLGLNTLIKIDPSDPKLLVGLAASGYAGTDFIENAFTNVIPRLSTSTGSASGQGGAQSRIALQSSARTEGLSTSSPVTDNATPSPFAGLVAALKIAAPRVNTVAWGPALTAAFSKFDISTDRRMAAAVGQFLVEAGAGFQELVENLNYTSAERLVEIFPSKFATVAAAEPYVGKPEAIGNRVYADRLGNGDESSGDGWRFRGRGLIQITGRDEYKELGDILGITPEEAATYCESIEGAAMSGSWYLSSRGCLVLADSWLINNITRRVNGSAMVGANQRLSYSNSMLKALGGI
ncbi:hypothetical protein MesoLj113a_45150 [Mesorhizobium sp. 113-1-2]|uniref:glycoside hydrolase family 19 protein n=1 Tax=Mesorhizobium sp. 113-1-2 TaxID=2744515 RepID=UPI0019272561|nr:glycoside hydrolase family 19 protein [Mesorhizobium sp. 113-1-2]BCG73357.1 hypothetical protein MesoLj113a_45150 [Mesorhizobium sp. 113-1-2]